MQSREQWLAERRTGVGSSDAAAVCGLSPWSDPFRVYLDKLGLLREVTSEPMELGLELEEFVAARYGRLTGRHLERPEFLFRHPERPWMLATPDRICTQELRIVELKTAGENRFNAKLGRHEWGEPGTDEVPEHYLIQVQHQMEVTGCKLADVAALMGGSHGLRFAVYTVARSERLIANLLGIEADFWARVERREPPDPDWSRPYTAELVQALHRPDPAVTVDLPPVVALSVTNYEDFGRDLKRLQAERDASKARIIAAMGNAAVGLLPDGREVHRKEITVPARTQEVREYSYTDFRVKKGRRA